ncbi:MarR family winged helix-turn-helix transcriptional regulator [Saccharopolyspora sp. K220]|uniref:MarR family winged helix-turn-helix transcriptional regulator n=1 Tax=Saccharopolyspora soli TaxID=2926618 RepID=UPI001F5955E6|nr:MarR family winged helix-turn-helix transcriptional regulator [Saccharopolyspora soli]MCI2418279.1 MarR family winged helix-turn-helix transcriptional regulator [Saccharopolyspora soli]
MTDSRWLTDEQQCAWRKFAALMTVVPAALDAQLQRDSGLTHFGYWVLAMLSEHPERALRMSDLAARANASPSRVSHVVSRLEQQGWVHRHRACSDGRGNIAELTDTGYEKLVAAAPGHVAKVRSLIFDGLSPDQVRQLDELCAAMLAHLDPTGTLTTAPPRD